MMVCNICGSSHFAAMNKRPNVKCVECGSVERTRILKIFIDKFAIVRPGMRVMHLSPEKGLAAYIKNIVGSGYEAYDLQPERYAHTEAKRMDLVVDCEALPSNTYDLILHSHVMEHIPCNITAVLFHLHRALKDNGTHLMCIPILSGYYDECLAPLPDEDRRQRFGQNDHVRRFGAQDIQRTLGMLFNLPKSYDLTEIATPDVLDKFNIPRPLWKGLSSSSALLLRKDDIKLKGL